MTPVPDHGRTDLRKAAWRRLRDAQALLHAGEAHTRAAMYLGGYVVECKLKAIGLEIYNCWTLDELASKWQVPDHEVYTHGLEAFARRLPLYNRLTWSGVWLDFSGTLNQWRPSWRYNPRVVSITTASAFLDSVQRVYHWLDSNKC